jgi:integrase
MSKRRGSGEGSIYQRADGRWCATYASGYASNGKRMRRTLFGKTHEEVRNKLTKTLSTRLDRPEFEPSRLKLCDYLNRWLEDAARTTIRVTTYQSYRGVIKNHINERIGGVPLAKLSAAHIQALYADMEADGCSARVRQLTHAVLRRALKQAIRWSLLMWNPCDAVQPPRVPHVEMVVLQPQEVTILLEAAKSERLEALFVLAVTTGMRLGELLGLQWHNVDLQRGAIQVRHTLVDVVGILELAEPKTQKSRRSIHLPEMAIKALSEHREAMIAEGLGDLPWVFCTPNGNPIRRSHFNAYTFKPFLARAGLPDIRFHDLRHTSATLLLSAGVHPKVVQERLGHAQIGVTLDTYSHVLPGMQREAAAKFDEMLAPKVVSVKGRRKAATPL